MSPAASTVTLESGVKLSLVTRGEPSGIPLLLLPGPTDSWRSYEQVLDILPPWIRTTAVSQRGHGDSDKPATGYHVHDFAADVPPLLDALGAPSAILAGHSGSCLVARRVALDHPYRVSGLVLEASPTTLRGHPRLIEFVETVIPTLHDPIDPIFARSFVSDTSSERLSPELVDRVVDELMKVPVQAWSEMFASLLAYDDMTEIDRITVPTLLVWGDADQLIDRSMQTRLADRIRGAELLVYTNVGHTPRWEEPIRFARDVAAFVERRVMQLRH